MRSRFIGGAARALKAGLFLIALASTARAQPFREVPAPQFASPASAAAAKVPMDELVYHDGDHVRGHFLKHEGDIIVFRSERFGVLRVPKKDADLVLAKQSPAGKALAKSGKQEKGEAIERAPFSPIAMARALEDFFGNWHGRFALAAEMMQDSSKHTSSTIESHLQRKWKADEVQLNARYDYGAVDEVTATDMVKADAQWRHDLPHKLFTLYQPTLEWNRAFYRDGQPADYVLLQEEAGLGINLVSTETRKVRTGVSENLFDTWVTPNQTHFSQNVESVFAEVETKLPWRVVVTDRGVWYYSLARETDGWENRFEVNKKLTETLTIGVRHEIRHNNPDVRSADYRRLRLLFGFDF